MYALMLKHRTLPGKREVVEAIWRQYMIPIIDANADHLSYVYSFGQQEDEIWAFQVYRSKEAASEFLANPRYLKYLDESRSLLAAPPHIEILDPRWMKAMTS